MVISFEDGGTQEPARNESVSVGTTSVTIAEKRSEMRPRKVIVIRNISDDSTKVISVNFGLQQAVTNTGIVLRQYESVTETTDAGYECWQDTITAKCAVAGGTLAIFER